MGSSFSGDDIPVEKFKFMGPLEVLEFNSVNGLIFNGIYVPEEVLLLILSQVPSKDLLGLSLVCKTWCNLIKSVNLWKCIYNQKHPDKAKNLPWYVYYCYFTQADNFVNLLKNGNGQEQYKHWTITRNRGDGFNIEDPPQGSDPLSKDVPDFNGKTSCFSTSFHECVKHQDIEIWNKRLLRYIIRKFRPHIYASEWVVGRFDCGCIYKLTLRGYDENCAETDEGFHPGHSFEADAVYRSEQFSNPKWHKVDIVVKDYSKNLQIIQFQHEGRDTQFWKGHYGSKMAGGVVKFLFDSIEPEADCDYRNQSYVAR